MRRFPAIVSSPSKSLQADPPAQTEGHRVSLERVSKVFGRVAAVRETSLEFTDSKIYVLLGDNGAGKSTLLRIVAGLIQPTSGTMTLHNLTREQMGYMAHASLLYDELSAMENLRYFAQLYGLTRDAEQHCESAMNAVALDAALQTPVRDYSQGMRQRLSLARALVH